MNHRQHPLFWSFGAGTWYGTRLRISWFYPLVFASLWFKFGLVFGSTIFGLLFFSVLFHEIGHILAARAQGGVGDEILMWPLGGLAFTDSGGSPRTQMITVACGPFVNFVLCGITLPAVLYSDYKWAAFNPLYLPLSMEKFGADSLTELQVLLFSLNWILLLINLLPAFPLDGGQIVRVWLVERLGGPMGTEFSIRVAYVTAIVLAVVSVFFVEHIMLLSIAFLLAVLAIQESQQVQAGENYEDSFMGYDFSQGYTSLERSERKEREPRPGILQRWLERRRVEKRRRQDLQQQEAELQLDALLAKVHENGIGGLTEAEKRMLKRASERYRGKGDESK